MALSQLQCLDENHINPRAHESKPEFFYCEEQRLALEVLLRDGREAFGKYLEARGLRGFLSDPELETFVAAQQPYDPGSELFSETAEDGDPPLSLHYWPDLSDTTVPQMDLGWPDSDSYRGVTRTTVYAQPPLDGQAHIKEVVRKMIAQAQKVIAVVMDVFTDVDIFRDLLDAGFKRRVSVYILLERTTLPHFLSMCQRANMHAGHLKHLRVRCTEGMEFYTRSCTKVKGRMGHRFMFVDGDKAVSGSYSFTWMSSRLDRNLITVVTGQAVEAFDRQFRYLYVISSSVDLREVATEPEPEPEPLPQPAAVVLPSAALARKLHNPKYALVALSSPAPSADNNSPKEPSNPENSKNPDVPETNKRRQKRASKEAIQDAPPLHPGLTDLEKACLIAYLPTWPEPDPPSDVIGFINIRDANRPTQVHLQRSEMFETSQAIRFSSPISVPKETLPEVAKPRQPAAKHEEMDKRQPTQDKIKAGECVVDGVQPAQAESESGDSKSKEEPTGQETSVSGKKSEPVKDSTTLTTETNLHSKTPISQDAGRDPAPPITEHTLSQSDMKTSSPNNQPPSHSTASSPEPKSPPASNSEKAETQSVVEQKKQTPESHMHAPANSNLTIQQHTQERTGLPLTNSLTEAVHAQPLNSSEMPPEVQAPSSASGEPSQTVVSTSLSENNHAPVTAPLTSVVSSSSVAPVTSSSTTLHPLLSLSTACSPLPPTPPIPKPRTVQLVIKHSETSDGQNLSEVSVIRRTESATSTGQPIVHSKPDVAYKVQTSLEKDPETLSELPSSKIGPQEDTENTGNPEESLQQTQSVASSETKDEEAVGLSDNGAETQAQPDALIADVPKADSGNIQAMIPKEVHPKDLTLTDCKITSTTQTDPTATVQTEKNNGTQHNTAQEPQRLSHCEMNPQDNDPLETVSAHTPVSNSPLCNDNPEDSSTVTSAAHTDGKTNVIKSNVHTNGTSQESQQTSKLRGSSHTPERPLRLYLSDTHIRDVRSQTPEREPRSLIRTPTPDGVPSCTPSPDSRMHTPDPRPYTPDFRTPTPDGYVSPRDDSTLSTTSEEYYECSDSPSQDLSSDCVGSAEDHVSFTQRAGPDATTITKTSTSCINNNTHASMLSAADNSNSCCETLSLSGPGKVCSPSAHDKKVKVSAVVDTINEQNGRGENENGTNVAKESRPELSTGGRVSSEAERPDKEMIVDKAAVRPSGVDKRDRPQSGMESDGQKYCVQRTPVT
ncbi:protein FAM83G-like isoform X2 [Anabas testudineus]|uniref:Scaffolding anchor of CK1 domain-containing protein n=1 Tax=Anabas testudineus TaxID=64144 RepID=A0A3Q1HEA9_ANATE|nr:protein FAM83G-like isoform X2 [Anabas testudineus]